MPKHIELKPVETDNFASIVMVVAILEEGEKVLASFLRSGMNEEQIKALVERTVSAIDLNAPRWASLRDIAVVTTLWGWNNPL